MDSTGLQTQAWLIDCLIAVLAVTTWESPEAAQLDDHQSTGVLYKPSSVHQL